MLRTCLALLVAGVGYVVLLGWYLGFPVLTRFGTDLIPMAPPTATLFLLYGLALYFRARMPLRRRAVWVITAAVCTGAAVSLLIFVLSCFGIHLEIEHPG